MLSSPRSVQWLLRPVIRGADKMAAEHFRAACLQNEIAPEKFLNRYEKRFEKREKGSEKRSETRWNIFEPLSGRLKIFHRHFSTNFKSFSQPKICTKKSFFHREALQGGATLRTFHKKSSTFSTVHQINFFAAAVLGAGLHKDSGPARVAWVAWNGKNWNVDVQPWERPDLLQSPEMAPTRNFHKKYRKKMPPGPKFLTPRIYPQNTPKIPKTHPQNTENTHFGIFSVFLGSAQRTLWY